MAGEMAQMAFEINSERDYWEHPKSLMPYSNFVPLKEETPHWERRLNRCEKRMINQFHTDIEERYLEAFGAVPCEWPDV